MEPAIKTFLEQLVAQMGTEHVQNRVGVQAKELLAQFGSSKPEQVPERWKMQLQERIRPDGTLDWREGAGMWLLKLPDQTLLSLSNPKRPMLRRGGRVIDGAGWCKTLEDVQVFVLALFEEEFDFVPGAQTT